MNCGYADNPRYAVEFYQQFIYSWPEDKQVPHAIQRMAIEHSKLGDEENADLAIEKLKNDYGDYSKKAESFFRLGQYYREDRNMYDKAAKLYEYAANNCPKNDDHTMFCQVELVKYYIRTGDPNKGNEQYNKLITEYKDNTNLASNMCFIGDTYLRAGDSNTANTLYTDVLKKWPNDQQTIFAKAGLAKVAVQLGSDSQAIQIIDEILTKYSDNPGIPKAVLGISEEYWNKALDERSKVLAAMWPFSSNPSPPESRPSLSDEGKRYYSNTCTTLEKILKASDTSDIMPEAYLLAAESCLAIEQYDKAIEYYHIIVDNWPNYKSAYHCQFMTGRIYEERKIRGEINAEAAEPLIRAAYEKMVSNYPDCTPAGLARMWLANHTQKTSQ